MKPPETPIARQSRPIQRRAVHVERRPVHGLVAHAAGPGGVPAAMAEAGDVTDQDVVRPEGVAVGASRGWVIHPPAVVCTRSPITPSSLGRAGTTQGQDLALGAVHHKEGRERDHLDGR
jgi:hypothetical protein